MGEEIAKAEFTRDDFRAFNQKLLEEAELLKTWFEEKKFAETKPTAGYELEACLIDQGCHPAPKNNELLEKLKNPLVVPELSQFNIEFNGVPEKLEGKVLSKLHTGLKSTWAQAQKAAEGMDLKILMIGILPTLKNEHMVQQNMSHAERYKALNTQIFDLRKGKPIELKIRNRENIHSHHMDVMLEAATTSFQIHLKVKPSSMEGLRYYNSSKIVSGPMVGIAANSPFLFGKDLWAETRIPLFEQAVSVGKWDYCERVTFGVRYIENSLFGVFQANRQRYPVLLPTIFDDPPEKMSHTRLHNGTIWRWTRPIIGFDDDGTPHLRIEHRVIPAGPSIIDQVANMAFYYGMVKMLVKEMPELVYEIPFSDARDNFYQAAQHGLDAVVVWKDKKYVLKDLILKVLIPLAREGLFDMGLDKDDISDYLGVIEGRVKTEQNGAAWQRAYMKKCSGIVEALCAAYYEHQESGQPVHEWSV